LRFESQRESFVSDYDILTGQLSKVGNKNRPTSFEDVGYSDMPLHCE